MKLLNLYVDKWYIIGAYCSDGVVMPIIPSTGDDRFWLFFYEDRSQEKVVYGLVNKKPYYSGTPLYHGDIFSCITDTKCCFERYGRKIAMSEVFHEAGILTELHDAVAPEGEKVSVRISFSRDISDAARVVFKREVLEANDFEVEQISADIDYLALYHAQKGHLIKGEGYYLVLNACNENLYYSLYWYDGNTCYQKGKEKLDGLGIDPRGRALVEDIVTKINQQQHFLTSDQEMEKEYCNLMQYVDHWLLKIDNVRVERPINISDVRLSCVPNVYLVSVLKAEIDKRTATIVEDIVRVITQFVQKQLGKDQQIKGVIMLGDTFCNKQFLESFSTRFVLRPEDYVNIPLSGLSRVVAVYEHIDGQLFSAELQDARGNEELADIKRKQAEAEAEAEAEKLVKDQREKELKLEQAERKYRLAMENVYDFEKKRDYTEMKEWATIALSLKTDDEDAQQKLDEATRLLSETKVRNEQYNNIIHRAQQSYEAKQWQDVLSLCDAALNLKAESQKARSMREDARRSLDNLALVEKYLTRADLFLAQRSYQEALDELDKVLVLDAHHDEAISKKNDIEVKLQEKKQKLALLCQQLQTAEATADYETAISIAQELGELEGNSLKWSERVVKIRTAQQQALAIEQQWQDLKAEFDSVLFEKSWNKVVSLGRDLLSMIENNSAFSEEEDSVRRSIKRAQVQLEAAAEEERYQDSLLQLKSLIADHDWEEASRKLREMRDTFLDHILDLKPYFLRILEGEESDVIKVIQPDKDERIIIDGFNSSSIVENDDFFANPEHAVTKPQKKKDPRLEATKIANDKIFTTSDSSPRTQKASKGTEQKSSQKRKSSSISDDEFFRNESHDKSQYAASQQNCSSYDPFFDDDPSRPK